MQKKLLMVAVGAALAAGAVVAQAETKVYGKFHMSLDRVDTDDPTPGIYADGYEERGFVSNNTSRFGIKGDEDLGGGMKAIYQAEIPFQADGESGSGLSGSNIATRNTFVGLSSGWGTLKVGKHDSPVKELGRSVDLFNERIGDARNLYAFIGVDSKDVAKSSTTEGGFLNNSIRYETPNFSGFTAVLQYSTGEYDAGANTVHGIGLRYTSGPLMVGIAHGANHSTEPKQEEVIRVAGSYDFGAFKLLAFYDSLSDGEVWLGTGTTADGRGDRDTFGLGASFKVGANGTVKVQYVMADEVEITESALGTGTVNDSDADNWTIGYDHALSKTTLVYAAYTVVNNGQAAAYRPALNGHGDSLAVDFDTSPNAFSVGMEVLF